jgi:hypothetical protein
VLKTSSPSLNSSVILAMNTRLWRAPAGGQLYQCPLGDMEGLPWCHMLDICPGQFSPREPCGGHAGWRSHVPYVNGYEAWLVCQALSI